MMTLDFNKQKMYYSLLSEHIPIYETDSEGNVIYYEDSEGNKIPIETGETEEGYKEAVEFFGNITMSGGETEAVEFGLNIGDYQAVLITNKDELPIDETSIIWLKSNVVYKETAETLLDARSADFEVLAVKPSLNTVKYVLKAITK